MANTPFTGNFPKKENPSPFANFIPLFKIYFPVTFFLFLQAKEKIELKFNITAYLIHLTMLKYRY